MLLITYFMSILSGLNKLLGKPTKCLCQGDGAQESVVVKGFRTERLK